MTSQIRKHADYQQDSPNVIAVTLRYGQIVPVKVISWDGIEPIRVCTRWGGIYKRVTQTFFEPVEDDSLTVEDRAECHRLITTRWTYPHQESNLEYKPIDSKCFHNRVETVEDVIAKYRNK